MISDILAAANALRVSNDGALFPCSSDPELFHDVEGESSKEKRARETEAKNLCLDCPVMIACAAIGRKLYESGIWGGETDSERRAGGYKPKPRSWRTNKPAVCGTDGGYQKHLKKKTKICDECRAARNAKRREDRRRKGAKPRKPADCGTRSGAVRHDRLKEERCERCIAAMKAYEAARTIKRRELRMKAAAG
ncbi:WhiB family transcriptional regulator [Streptomyces sp. NPDC008079]|uniref:WhiB family transcriptional regulator n=1 Tax=Streptomyces sp. NPDC008079 TaxID=3364806 RepID=UPI0036EC5E1A